MKLLSGFCLAVLLLLAFGDSLDLITYSSNPSAYRFGTEVAGFRYLSSTHFIVSIIVTIIGAVTGLLVSKIVSSARVVLLVRFALIVILMALRYV